MSNTKKSFMTASAVLGFVFVGLAAFIILFLFSASSMVTTEFVTKTLGTEVVNYTMNEIELIVTITKGLFLFAAIYLLAMGIVTLILSLRLLKKVKNNDNTNGANIALMIISLFTAMIVSVGLLIAAICLSKPAQQSGTPEQIVLSE